MTERWDRWLAGSFNEAMALQRPLPDEMLRLVARGEKTDQALAEK
jgi:putative SOS response-associated peptidase YedK